MKNYYCLGTSDSQNKIAIDILKIRLEEKKYPLYQKTPFLHEVKKKDEVIFYIAGKNTFSQNFFGSAIIENTENTEKETVDPDKNKHVVIKNLILRSINIFKTPIPIKLHIKELEFIKNKKNYGISFMGGVSKITQNDFNLIKK